MTSSAASARQYSSRSSRSSSAQRPLARRVGLEHRGHCVDVVVAPREMLRDDARQWLLRIHGARVDVQQRALLREAALALGVAVLLPDHVDQVSRVARVEHPETGWQIERRRMQPQEPVRDGVKGAADHAARPGRHRDQRAGALQHLGRGPAGEGEEHDALGRHACRHQPRDACAERGGLAGAGAGQDQERPAGMGRGRALLGIQPREPITCVGRRGDCAGSEHAFGTLWRGPDGGRTRTGARRERRAPVVGGRPSGGTAPWSWACRCRRERRSSRERAPVLPAGERQRVVGCYLPARTTTMFEGPATTKARSRNVRAPRGRRAAPKRR